MKLFHPIEIYLRRAYYTNVVARLKISLFGMPKIPSGTHPSRLAGMDRYSQPGKGLSSFTVAAHRFTKGFIESF